MPKTKQPVAKRSDLLWVLVSEIEVDDKENYTRSSRGDIEGLAMTIASEGIQNPLRAYKEDGIYHLRSGFRRMAAVRFINDGGLDGAPKIERVPIMPIPRHTNEADRDLLQVLENAHRVDASPIEEARAIRKLIDVHGLTRAEVAQRLGMAPKTVRDRLNLMQAAQPLRDAMRKGDVSASAAADIARKHPKDPEAQKKALELAKGPDGKATARSARRAIGSSKPRQTTRGVVEVKEALEATGAALEMALKDGRTGAARVLEHIKRTLEWTLGGEEKPWEHSS